MNYDNYNSKEEKDGLWESHIKYLDVQVMLDGEEYIAVNNIKNMKKKSKDQKNDIIFSCYPCSPVFYSCLLYFLNILMVVLLCHVHNS